MATGSRCGGLVLHLDVMDLHRSAFSERTSGRETPPAVRVSGAGQRNVRREVGRRPMDGRCMNPKKTAAHWMATGPSGRIEYWNVVPPGSFCCHDRSLTRSSSKQLPTLRFVADGARAERYHGCPQAQLPMSEVPCPCCLLDRCGRQLGAGGAGKGCGHDPSPGAIATRLQRRAGSNCRSHTRPEGAPRTKNAR